MILANLIPVAGVLFWGWSLSVILFLYWLESLVIGVVNIGYLIASNGEFKERMRPTLFFIVHYGFFWVGHGVFLFVLLMPEIAKYAAVDQDSLINSAKTIRYAFWGFAVSHVLSFIIYIATFPRHQRLPPSYQMFTPYGRVFVMHIVILGGAMVAAKYSNILSVVLLFVGLKIVFELGSMLIGKSWRRKIETDGALS